MPDTGGVPAADDLVLREMTDRDWPAVWGLLEPVMRAGETYCWPRDVTADQARPRWIEPPPARTYVAALPDGTVVGTAQLHPNQDAAGSHVANAGFVTSSSSGVRGVGRRLGEHVVAEAARQGYRAMQFDAVVETNTRAVALWRSLGFEVVGTVPEAFDHPADGLVGLHVMHRRL